MEMRYWMNRLALVLLALPVLGVVVSTFLGRGALLRAGPQAMQGPMYGLLVSTGTWLAAWSQIRRQEIRRQEELSRAAARENGRSAER